MCRLLGVVSRAPLPLSTTLGELAARFTELSQECCRTGACWKSGGVTSAYVWTGERRMV